MTDFSKLCRACLSAIDTLKYNLFEDVSPDVYWFCTNIEVAKDENLPKSICKICYDLITKFSEFKKMCLQSQNTLLNYYSVLPENKKIDWLKNEPEDLDTQEGVINKFEEKEEEKYNVTVKPEDLNAYDDFDNAELASESILSDFDTAELASELDVKVERNKSHKKVRVKPVSRRKKLKCELCPKSFLSHDRFEVHKLAHQRKKPPYICTPCNKTFITWGGLKRHQASWHVRVSLSSVKCRTCGKIAKSRESLRVHEKLHGERILFPCNVCGRTCTTRGVLKAHLETHKANRERYYTCEHCGKKFYTNKILVSHVQRCHTGRRYICQICSYPFTDKYNLGKHLLNHDGKGRAFKCVVCNKSFTARASYTEHQRTHSGERPFVCNYCSKRFISKRRLIEHLRTHTGEKPHKCPVCDHSFTQRGTLTRHMKVHDRIVPVIN